MAPAVSHRRSRPSRSGGHLSGSDVPRSPTVADTLTTRWPLATARAMIPPAT